MPAASLDPFTILNPRSIVKQIVIETAKRLVPIVIVGAVGGYVTYRLVKACRNRYQAKSAPPEPPADDIEGEAEPIEPEPKPRPKRTRRRKARPEPA
jgi:aspartokinase